ncbi:hypothetical protein [Bifidobacterium bombi]|uniref:Uncharacterized protein n=1 Tax=Bifidobacterium bombi DSM 19703 TaxID=1341695 RepID=A0A080N3H7_9BIFI|nr:hypothetical protein [Bifidobacterium bombi]KFF31707.1 hypothetical protein BBOMB_1094 [Bifidobacterium bombi DSM 19703]
MSFFNRHDEASYVYPTDPVRTYRAVVAAVNSMTKFKLTGTNDRQLSCLFTTGWSAFTWGDRLTATVAPNPNGSGCVVRITADPRANGSLYQARQQKKEINMFFKGLSEQLSVPAPAPVFS